MVLRGDILKNYAALIIDLKKSRGYSVEDRNSIQKYIVDVIGSLNEVFKINFAKEVTFSAGDEIQGLFLSPEAAYLYFRMFIMLVSPVEVRAGIGIGEWNVKIQNANTNAQDGPAYHNARHAIENVNTGYSLLLYSKKEVDMFINTMINTPIELTKNHSEYQNEILLLSELLYPIDFGSLINYNQLSLISKLIGSKNQLDYYKNSKLVKEYPFDKAENLNNEIFPLDASKASTDFYVNVGKKRGMTTRLSEILNISRQSIEKTFKTANIYEYRNSTIAALKFMNKYL